MKDGIMGRDSTAMRLPASQKPSAGELVRQLSEQVSVLVRDGMADRTCWRGWQPRGEGGDDQAVYQLMAMLVSILGVAIFDLVKAVIDRGTAEGIRKFTAVWPGGNREPSGEGA